MKLDLFPCLARDRKSPTQREESPLIFSAKKLICIGKKSVSQTACLLSEVNKYTTELSFGSLHNTLSRSAQISTYKILHKVVLSAEIDDVPSRSA